MEKSENIVCIIVTLLQRSRSRDAHEENFLLKSPVAALKVSETVPPAMTLQLARSRSFTFKLLFGRQVGNMQVASYVRGVERVNL